MIEPIEWTSITPEKACGLLAQEGWQYFNDEISNTQTNDEGVLFFETMRDDTQWEFDLVEHKHRHRGMAENEFWTEWEETK